jgi:5-methylcytosine-specific restriction endonuclease McrA
MGRYRAWISEAARRQVYQEYMQSPAWARKRQQVLDRDGGIGQGCGMQPAEHVHHLTYERFGREMLFDLTSVCTDCHKQIHGRMQ